MFKKRVITDAIKNASYIRSECTESESFQKCTHVFVKESSHHVTCPPGLYEYKLNGWLFKDGEPFVGASSANLLDGLTNGKLELLTHAPTLDEIIETQEQNKKEE